jgi:hypothetical protein
VWRPGIGSLAEMEARPTCGRQRGYGIVGVALALAFVGCSPVSTPTYFIPPTEGLHPSATGTARGPGAQPAPSMAQPVIVPTLILATPTPPCTNGLTYDQDLTIPDGSNMAPGQGIDKEWQVTNSGTCNWDERYRLKLVGGDAMGANPLQPLYPARAGTKVTLRVIFTAPQTAGLYQCQWQAVDPDSQPFGDAFYMSIAVSP